MNSLRTLAIAAALLALVGCSGNGNGRYYGGYGYGWDDDHHNHGEGTGPDRSPGGRPGMIYKPGSVPSGGRSNDHCVLNCDK